MRITCADCGSVQVVPPLPPRAIAECHRCDRLLDRHAATSLGLSMASASAMLLVLPFAAFHPLLESTIRNLVFEESRLITSVPVIYREVWFPFAFGFLFFALLFPALRALFLVIVLGSLHRGWSFAHLGRVFRWNQELRIWSMTDVVVVAGVATYFAPRRPPTSRSRPAPGATWRPPFWPSSPTVGSTTAGCGTPSSPTCRRPAGRPTTSRWCRAGCARCRRPGAGPASPARAAARASSAT